MRNGTQATTYESYQGNSYRVDLGGKNLLAYDNGTYTNAGVTTINTNNNYVYSGTVTQTYFRLNTTAYFDIPAGTYTLSRNVADNGRLTLRLYWKDSTYTNYTISNGTTSTTFTTTQKSNRSYLYIQGLTADTYYSGNVNIQLEKRKSSNSFQSLCI